MAAPVTGKKQAHCLLISANQVRSPYPVYPIGIAHIMGALHQNGHKADHFDVLASGGYSVLEGLLQTNSYDVIGISIRNIDNVDSSSPKETLSDIITAIEYVRTGSKAPVVLGGPGFSIMPERLLAYLKADYGIVGEGEAAFPQLVEKIIEGGAIEERLFSENISAYPSCSTHYSEDVAPYYISQGGMLNVQTKRGCNYGCTYCSYPTIEGRRLRHRPPLEVVTEIKRLSRDFEARYIFFTDAVFNDPDDHYLQIAEELIRAGSTTPWCAFFRPQNLDKKGLRLLKRSGMASMELGTDASTNRTLKALNKGFSIEDVIELNEIIASESLPCAHFIMFGGPDESEETVLQGIRNIERLNHCVVFAYIGIRILPGTKMYSRSIEDQIITAATNLIPPVFYYSPQVSREFIDTQLRQSFQGKRDRIYPMADMEKLIPLLHSMGHDGPLWDLLIDTATKQ